MIDDDLDVVDTVDAPAMTQPEVRAASPLSSAPGLALSAVAAAALAACGGGGGGGSSGSSASVPTEAGRAVTLDTTGSTQLAINPAPGVDDAKISRFLQQAQFAANDADIAAVKAKGYKAWLESQTAMGYTTAWYWLNAQGFTGVDSVDNQFADDMAWSQIIGSPDAYRRRAALALSEILVVSLNGLNFNWRNHAMTAYWDILCKHALGNFRDLLQDVTLSPAMGYYLNAKGSTYRKDIQPDENYAREVMQLFTIGLVKLNSDGTPEMNGTNTIDSYSAADVSAIAHVFTGWDVDTSQGGGANSEFTRRPMVFNKSNHSTLAGVSAFGGALDLNKNKSGLQKLNDTLDYLFMHANTPHFVCRRLIQSLVTSNPSLKYVQDVAAKFIDNGSGKRGDLAHVFAAILLHDEARRMPTAGDTESGKLREPMVRLVQWARTFGVRSATGRWNIGDLSDPGTEMGQSPLRSPTVFNFFKPGFVSPASTLSPGKVAPEFQLVNETSVSGYLNHITMVIEKGINNQSDMKAAYTAELALATNSTALVNRLNTLLCGGQLSTATMATIVRTLDLIVTTVTVKNVSTTTVSDDDRKKRVYAAVLMVMACPGYLIQK